MKNIKVSMYKQIENDIIDKINTKIYPTGSPLPTESELTKIYNCSRVTVRQALNNLELKGYISKTQGSGSYVNKPITIQRTPLLKSFSEEIRELGKIPSSKLYSFNLLTAGNTIANQLKISPNDQIYYIERTRFADDTAVLFEKTFMSVNLHPEISIKDLLKSKYKYGDEHDLAVDYSYQTITPIFPPEYIAKELNINVNQPIIRACNTTYLDDGRVFDYTELYFHPELYQLNIIKKR